MSHRLSVLFVALTTLFVAPAALATPWKLSTSKFAAKFYARQIESHAKAISTTALIRRAMRKLETPETKEERKVLVDSYELESATFERAWGNTAVTWRFKPKAGFDLPVVEWRENTIESEHTAKKAAAFALAYHLEEMQINEAADQYTIGKSDISIKTGGFVDVNGGKRIAGIATYKFSRKDGGKPLTYEVPITGPMASSENLKKAIMKTYTWLDDGWGTVTSH
jgi:hypothetical protein